jgi:cysteine synthase
MGVREQIIFPEFDYDAIDQVRGMDISFTTTATNDEEAYALLEAFGMPFQRADERSAADVRREQEQAEAERQAKAQAEQAALEQLKEENPEAYERPAEPEEGEAEAAEGAEEQQGS